MFHHGRGGINFIVPEQRNPQISAFAKLVKRVGRYYSNVEKSAVLSLRLSDDILSVGFGEAGYLLSYKGLS